MSPIYQSAPARQIGWRAIESAAIDTLRRSGATLRDSGGITWLVDEILDEDSGQLVQTRYLINLEKFARTLAHELSVTSPVTENPRTIFDGCQTAILKAQKFRRQLESPPDASGMGT
jgi:hypothetical protein